MKRLQQTIIVVFMGWLMLAMQSVSAAERGALFKVSGHGHTMHLFGTMHVGLPEYYPLEPRIRQAVEQASLLALEIDPLEDPARMAQAVQTYGMHDPHDPKARETPPALKPRLDKALRSYSMEPAAVAPLKPWLIATVLAMGEFAVAGVRPDLSVDRHLAMLARERKVPVIALESVDLQMNMFNRLSAPEQWQVLADTVGNIESGRQRSDVRMIVDAWSRADQKALEAIALQAENDTSTAGRFLQQVLLEERNGPLADKLEAMLKQQDKVVGAIGVLHLVGKSSVPAKLRARGITVERVY